MSILNNYSKKQQQKLNKKPIFKAVPRNKRASSHNKTFQKVYASIIHRKDNEFSTLQSPHLNQQIDDLKPIFNNHFRASLGSSPSTTPIAIQRKKYIHLKQRIDQSMQQSSYKTYNSMKDLFKQKQQILTQFLNDFANQISRQCKQKGDILKYIWNTMINMIESISEHLSSHIKQKQKEQLQNNLKSHIQYQSLIEGYQKKQVILSEKNRMQRITIDSLVYQLRFKRKQIHKLYRNQKLLVNKINQYKIQNLNLQSSYIDLICSLKEVPHEKIELLLKARQEINKNKQIRFKVGNRKISKSQIKSELTNQKIEELENLYQEIKQIANNQVNSPQLVSTLIQASIQNFGLKNDDPTLFEERIAHVPQKMPKKINAQTQISQSELRDKKKTNSSTQFSFVEKSALQLIQNKNIQTYCQYPKKKLLVQNHSQVQIFQINHLITKKFTIKKMFEQTILPKIRIEQIPKIKMEIAPEKHHKKNYSDFNMHGSLENVDLNELQDFIEQKLDNYNSQQYIDEQLNHKRTMHKKRTKLKKSTKKIINNGNQKERFNSITSNSSVKVSKSSSLLEIQQVAKKSNFGPFASRQQSQNKQNKADNKNEKQLSEIKYTLNSRQSVRKGIIPKFKSSNYQISKSNFLQKNNYFNIEIDAEKQAYINKMFVSNQYEEIQLQYEQMKKILENVNFQLQKIHDIDINQNNQNFHKNDQKSNHFRRSSGFSVAKSTQSKHPSDSLKYNDENELLINLCRSNYFKTHKKLKQKVAIFKYHDQFTSVKDKITFIAKDVKELIIKKQSILKKTINPKNLKNIYKILMMTFSKAYNSYNKGILKGNLIYPLFQSFSLVYGAINSNQIYKKMVNFIAALTLGRENPILRFFLFFLGLDQMSPYSEKVTVSQVYLCLKLLQSISVDGKVTLNIQSIYTDTTHIKQQLISILKQQKIPQILSKNIENRVTQQLENSNLFQKSGIQSIHLKLNIYNIILLIIQQVIKCKNGLQQTCIPFLLKFEQYQTNKKLPAYIIQILLSDKKFSNFDPIKLKYLTDIITNNGKRDTITIQQFCSILFQHNIVSIDQLYQRSQFVYKRNWKIPQSFIEEIKQKMKNKVYMSNLQKKQAQMFLKISPNFENKHQTQENSSIEKMRRLIFEKHYERIVELTLSKTIGSNLSLLTINKTILASK